MVEEALYAYMSSSGISISKNFSNDVLMSLVE
jgi:hypothetical protein